MRKGGSNKRARDASDNVDAMDIDEGNAEEGAAAAAGPGSRAGTAVDGGGDQQQPGGGGGEDIDSMLDSLDFGRLKDKYKRGPPDSAAKEAEEK